MDVYVGPLHVLIPSSRTITYVAFRTFAFVLPRVCDYLLRQKLHMLARAYRLLKFARSELNLFHYMSVDAVEKIAVGRVRSVRLCDGAYPITTPVPPESGIDPGLRLCSRFWS